MSDTFNRSNFTAQQNLASASGDDTISASGNVLAFGGSGGMNFLNRGSGNFGVSGGLGSVTMVGGETANDQLVAGRPPGGVIGAGTGDQLPAAGGNETLSGFGTTANTAYFGGTGSDFVNLGAGAERYVGGRGNDVVVAGLGNDVIAGLKVHTDIVPLQGVASGADPRASQTAGVSAGSTVLRLPDGTVVTMLGVTHLTSSLTP